MLCSCATPVKTTLGEIHPDSLVAGERVIQTLSSVNTASDQYRLYQTDYKEGKPQHPWLRQRFYAVNAPIENGDIPLLSLFLTAEQKVTHKAIMSPPPRAKTAIMGPENYSYRDHPGEYVYYYDPTSGYIKHNNEKVNGFFTGQIWETFGNVVLSYAVIQHTESHPDLFKGIYHAFTKQTHWRRGFDTPEGIEVTKIASPGIVEGYGFLQPKTGREFLLYKTDNEIILIRVTSNMSNQKTADRFDSHNSIKGAAKRQREIFAAANKPLKKCDTAFDRKRCDEEQFLEAQRQQEANRKRSEEIAWENWWKNLGGSSPGKFCRTLYGTPKDGLQTNVTTCK